MIWIPLIWYFIFLLGPLTLIIFFSFLSRGTYGGINWTLQFENYYSIFDPDYLRIILRSIEMATSTTLLCLFVSLPLAWKLATMSLKKRVIFLFIVCLPFFMNSLVRIYSLKLWFYHGSPVDLILKRLDVGIEISDWSQGSVLTLFGMVSTYLAFMIFPIYSAFDKIDFAVIEAAQDLGAQPLLILHKVLMPMLKIPILNGCLLVFIPSFGEFLIPDLLGGAKSMLVGNLITDLFLKSRDWPLGSALTVGVLSLLGLIHFSAHKISKRFSHSGMKKRSKS